MWGANKATCSITDTIASVTLWWSVPGLSKVMLKDPALAYVPTHYPSEDGLMGEMARNDGPGSMATCKTSDSWSKKPADLLSQDLTITEAWGGHFTSLTSPPSASGRSGDRSQGFVAWRRDLGFRVSTWEPLIEGNVWTHCWRLSEKWHHCNPECL